MSRDCLVRCLYLHSACSTELPYFIVFFGVAILYNFRYVTTSSQSQLSYQGFRLHGRDVALNRILNNKNSINKLYNKIY